MDIYKIVLRLKTPSEKGKSLDFRDETQHIIEAALIFNDKFRVWSKRIIITEIDPHNISLLLFIEKEKAHVTPRELRSFTAYLNNQCSWEQYSREKSKLFSGTSFKKISIDETIQILSAIQKSEILEFQKSEADKILELLSANQNIKLESGNDLHIDMVKEQELSDDQAVAIFDYLIKTQALGMNHVKKQQTISHIKNILMEWV